MYTPPDLTLRHRPSAVGTAKCSATNQTAICTGTKVQILTPSSVSDVSKSDFDIVDFDIKSASASKYSKVEREETDETLSIGDENDVIAVAAEWSPLGLSRMYGCVLAVLDSHHRASIWESTGVGICDNWISIANLSDELFEKRILSDNVEAEDILSGKKLLNARQCAQLKAHCISIRKRANEGISWSSSCDSSARRQKSLLAVGDAIGTITLWSFTRDKKLQFKCSWELPTDGSAVSHLTWSPWVDIKTSLPFNKVSILAASRNDGSIHLGKVLINTMVDETIDIHEIQPNMTRELYPKQRIPVSKLAWKLWKDDVLLAIARNSSLSVSIHPIEHIMTLTSKVVVCRHENYSPVVELLMSSSDISLDVMVASQLLPIMIFRLSSNKLNVLPTSTDLVQFFATKHDTCTSPGTKSFFKIFGVNASFNNTVLNFYFELLPNDRPQYRTAIDFRSRLSTLIFRDINSTIDEHIAHIEHIISNQHVSLEKYAWEGKVLYQAASVEKRTAFAKYYLDHFDEQRQAINYVEDLNDIPPDIRKWQYWITLDAVVKMSSDSALPEEIQNRLAEKRDYAISIIHDHIHTWLSRILSDSPTPLLNVVLGLYRLFRKSLAPVPSEIEIPPEICGICKDPIPAKSLTFGCCARGHIFERCSITLLTLSTPFSYTCRVCGRKMIERRAFLEDPEWCEAVFSGNTQELDGDVPDVNRCMYCGGEWIRKI